MRRVIVECNTRREAKRLTPWAPVLAKVEGGYMAFESAADYATWRRQR